MCGCCIRYEKLQMEKMYTSSQRLQSTSVTGMQQLPGTSMTASCLPSTSMTAVVETDVQIVDEDIGIQVYSPSLQLSMSNPSSGGTISLSCNIQPRPLDVKPLDESEETTLKQLLGSSSMKSPVDLQPPMSPEATSVKRAVESQQPSTSPEETPRKQVVESSQTQLSAIETTMKIVKTPATEIQEDPQEDPQETTYKRALFDYNPNLSWIHYKY